MSELRDKIARVALEHRRVKATNFGSEYSCLCGEVLASNSHHVLSKHQADKMLAVLADLPDDVIERAARAIDPAAWDESLWQDGGRAGVLPESVGAEATRDDVKGEVREVFRAAFGGEQNAE